MKRFWISWYQPSEDYRPLTYPPNAAVIGWWRTGDAETMSGITAYSLVALIEARSARAARSSVRKDWPEAACWRFCDEKPSGWLPNDRFPLSDWMRERTAAKPE